MRVERSAVVFGWPKLISKIDMLTLIVAGARPEQNILERAYLLGGNCFLRLREALRGSKLSDKAPSGPLEPRPDDCSSSSVGSCIESDLTSVVTLRRAFKQRVHIAGLDMRRRARVNWQDLSVKTILEVRIDCRQLR